MIFYKHLEDLKKTGFNIFLSMPVIDIPENIYPFSDEQKSKNLCMIGAGGSTLWENLPRRSTENHFDDFTNLKVFQLSQEFLNDDIEILFPNDELILPLQRLSRHFNFSHQSPIGLDISIEFGLWFAFRSVFLTAQSIPQVTAQEYISPCDNCFEKPCLKAVGLKNARLSCPIKIEHQYPAEQMEYHESILKKLINYPSN